MEKMISQEESYQAKATKKDNLEFADLWNKKNIKIANELHRTMNADKGKMTNAAIQIK